MGCMHLCISLLSIAYAVKFGPSLQWIHQRCEQKYEVIEFHHCNCPPKKSTAPLANVFSTLSEDIATIRNALQENK